MLKVGDKVEIIEHSDQKYIGENGEVIHVGTGIKGTTQPVVVELPKRETEPRYSIALDNGKELHYLRERQLRKLED